MACNVKCKFTLLFVILCSVFRLLNTCIFDWVLMNCIKYLTNSDEALAIPTPLKVKVYLMPWPVSIFTRSWPWPILKVTEQCEGHNERSCSCESWTLIAELQRRIQAMEVSCYRKILHISYEDQVTDKEVCAKIQQAIGLNDGLQTQTELVWTSCLAKAILQGTVKGGGGGDQADRRRGGKTTSGKGQAWSSPRPRGQWRTEETRRKLVVKSYMVPRRLSRLRDRWRCEEGWLTDPVLNVRRLSTCPSSLFFL